MQVPLLDLKAQYATIKDEVLAAVAEVLESQRCIGGPKVEELETQIAQASDCKYAVGVSSGTDALLSCLMSLQIGPGDEVITTPFTFFATVGCIARVGARPVFVDIDPKTYNIDPDLIEAAVSKKTKAIMPVHLFGQMAEMDPIMDVADRYNLAVIEDAAQSITSTYKDKKAGSIGAAGCFSFFPSKNLGGAGDGGMVVTSDPGLADRVRLLRGHGAHARYFHDIVGFNSRLDELQAAVLRVKLPCLDRWSEGRRRNAAAYGEEFRAAGLLGVLQPPEVLPGRSHIFHQYVIRAERRDELQAFLRVGGIGSEVYYPVPLHEQECFRGLGYGADDFPRSRAASRSTLALPVYPELSAQQRRCVVDRIARFYRGAA